MLICKVSLNDSLHCIMKSEVFFIMYLQGTLIQHLKEHVLHGNMSRQDVIIYYTTVNKQYSFSAVQLLPKA